MFLAPWSRSRSCLKKIPGGRAGAAWEKNQKPEPLGKKSGAGVVKKITRLLSPESIKNGPSGTFMILLSLSALSPTVKVYINKNQLFVVEY